MQNAQNTARESGPHFNKDLSPENAEFKNLTFKGSLERLKILKEENKRQFSYTGEMRAQV